MSFIRHKIIKGNKYAYEITAYWDHETKKPRQHSKYLGAVDEAGDIVKPGVRGSLSEKLILDFGDGYFLNEAMKSCYQYDIMRDSFADYFKELMVLIFYRTSMQSAMYNCKSWLEGNIISKLYPDADLSSQNISRALAYLGDEAVQRKFFSNYINKIGGVKKSVIIDATSLPNEINSGFNSWGRSDGAIEKQFRLLCVLDLETKSPIFYRYLPGNITDVSSLKTTILELAKIGVESSFALLDAGYFSENNVNDLYQQKIDFLTRMPAGRKIYKDLIGKKNFNIEKPKNATKFGTRGMFIEEQKIDLYGHRAYAYIVLDPARKGKEMNELLLDHLTAQNAEDIDDLAFNKCGIMVLVSSKKIAAKEVIGCYYMRQSVEQVFGYYKEDLASLPIRRHNEDTIRGYLFLQFLVLIFFIQIRDKLLKSCTVEQAICYLRNLKCKLFDKEIITSEPTKKHKEIFGLFNIIVPNSLGI